ERVVEPRQAGQFLPGALAPAAALLVILVTGRPSRHTPGPLRVILLGEAPAGGTRGGRLLFDDLHFLQHDRHDRLVLRLDVELAPAARAGNQGAVGKGHRDLERGPAVGAGDAQAHGRPRPWGTRRAGPSFGATHLGVRCDY